MLIFSIFCLLLSNAVNLRRDKSILYYRSFITALLYSSFIALGSLSLNLDTGIGLFGGLFHTTTTSQVFSSLIYLQCAALPVILYIIFIVFPIIILTIIIIKLIKTNFYLFIANIETRALKDDVFTANLSDKKQLAYCFTISYFPIIWGCMVYIFNAPLTFITLVIITGQSLVIILVITFIFINNYYNKYNYYKDLLALTKLFRSFYQLSIVYKLLVLLAMVLFAILMISFNSFIFGMLDITEVSLSRRLSFNITIFTITNYTILKVTGKLNHGIFSDCFIKCFSNNRLITLIVMVTISFSIRKSISLEKMTQPNLASNLYNELLSDVLIYTNHYSASSLISSGLLSTTELLSKPYFNHLAPAFRFKSIAATSIFEVIFGKHCPKITYYKVAVPLGHNPVFKDHYEAVAFLSSQNVKLKDKFFNIMFNSELKHLNVKARLLNYYNTFGCRSKPQQSPVDSFRYQNFKIWLYGDGKIYVSKISPKQDSNWSSQAYTEASTKIPKLPTFVATQATLTSFDKPSVYLKSCLGAQLKPNIIDSVSLNLKDVTSPSTNLMVKSTYSPVQHSESPLALTAYITSLLSDINDACIAKDWLNKLLKVKGNGINIEHHIIQSKNIIVYPVEIITNDVEKVNIIWAWDQYTLLNKAADILQSSVYLQQNNPQADYIHIYDKAIHEQLSLDMSIAIDNHLRHFHRHKYEDLVTADEQVVLRCIDSKCFPSAQDVYERINLSYKQLIDLYNNNYENIFFSEDKIPLIYLSLAVDLISNNIEPQASDLEFARAQNRRRSSVSEDLWSGGNLPQSPNLWTDPSSFNLPQPSNQSYPETLFQPELPLVSSIINNPSLQQVVSWMLESRIKARMTRGTSLVQVTMVEIGFSVYNLDNNTIIDNMPITTMWDLLLPWFNQIPSDNVLDMHKLVLSDWVMNNLIYYAIKHSAIYFDLNIAKEKTFFLGRGAVALAAELLNPVTFINEQPSVLEAHAWLETQLYLVTEIEGYSASVALYKSFALLGLSVVLCEKYPIFEKVYKTIASALENSDQYGFVKDIRKLSPTVISKRFLKNLLETSS